MHEMCDRQANYRDLYDKIIHSGAKAIYEDLIVPWLENTQPERATTGCTEVKTEDLWRLYALGRLNELLLVSFQGGFLEIGSDQYKAIMESLGLSLASHAKFNSFFHEVVEVVPADNKEEKIKIREVKWPAVMSGDLLISRAGCVVQGGADVINKQIAEKSTLYWSHRRENRSFNDLSLGWGSNSRWRTQFRRDYKIGDKYYFNIDAPFDVSGEARNKPKGKFQKEDLSLEERIELLTNRCFIKTEKQNDDLFPFNWSYSCDEKSLEKDSA